MTHTSLPLRPPLRSLSFVLSPSASLLPPLPPLRLLAPRLRPRLRPQLRLRITSCDPDADETERARGSVFRAGSRRVRPEARPRPRDMHPPRPCDGRCADAAQRSQRGPHEALSRTAGLQNELTLAASTERANPRQCRHAQAAALRLAGIHSPARPRIRRTLGWGWWGVGGVGWDHAWRIVPGRAWTISCLERAWRIVRACVPGGSWYVVGACTRPCAGIPRAASPCVTRSARVALERSLPGRAGPRSCRHPANHLPSPSLQSSSVLSVTPALRLALFPADRTDPCRPRLVQGWHHPGRRLFKGTPSPFAPSILPIDPSPILSSSSSSSSSSSPFPS